MLKPLKVVIAREFLHNLLNLRFTVGLALCLTVTVACIIILSHDYRQELADYSRRVNLQGEFLGKYALTDWINQMMPGQKPPERFRPVIIGIPGNETENSLDENPLPILFPRLDSLFIVTIVMSLLALLFSYDAVTGERERGTLRQMISNSVSRTTILLGKFLGGIASLLIPFILALLVGVLCINLNPNIHWDGSAWAELGLLIAASLTFITSFYLLGLMVSTWSRSSSVSMLNCLFLWVLLVLVIPNVGPYISAQLRRIPSIRAMERQAAEIKRAWLEAGPPREKEVVEQFRGKYGGLFSQFEALGFGQAQEEQKGNPEKVGQLAAADPRFKAMVESFRDELARLGQERRTALNKAMLDLGADLRAKAAAQTRLAKYLAAVSPLADFVYVARDLTGTGLRSLKYFEKSQGEYRWRFRQYASGVEAAVEAAHKNEPRPEGGWFLDLRDHPRFVFQEEPWKDKLGAVLPYWGILGLFNVVFFAGAFAGFVRYDVR